MQYLARRIAICALDEEDEIIPLQSLLAYYHIRQLRCTGLNRFVNCLYHCYLHRSLQTLLL